MSRRPKAAGNAGRSCRRRAGVSDVSRCNDLAFHEVKIGSLGYQRAFAITAAIDALAAELTGERDYFHTLGAGATKEQLRTIEERAVREWGELPWKISEN